MEGLESVMKRVVLLAGLLGIFGLTIGDAATSFPIVGTVQINPPHTPQPGGFNVSTGTVQSLTISGLSGAAGNCLQAGIGGVIISAGTPCGSGGGGGGGNGNINPAPQFSFPFFSSAGSTNTLSGDTAITTDGSGNLRTVTVNSTNGYFQGNNSALFIVPASSVTSVGNSLNSFGSGIGLTALGRQALGNQTTGGYSTAVGVRSLFNENNSINLNQFNSAFGVNSLFFTTVGINNAAFGDNTCLTNVGGIGNTCLGSGSDMGQPGLTNATAIGFGAVAQNSNTTAIGGLPGTFNSVNLVVSTITTTGIGVNVPAVSNQSIKIDNPGTSGDSYGINSTADGPGGTTHIGLYGWASGASTNYGLWVASGAVRLANYPNTVLATNSLGVVVSTTISATAGIQNTSTLQAGATFYVSSGTVSGPFAAQSLSLNGTGNFSFFNIPDNTTYQVIGTSVAIPPGDAIVMGASNTIVDGGTSGSGLLAANNAWTGTNSFSQPVTISSKIVTNTTGGNTLFSRNGLLVGSTSQVNIYMGSAVVGENAFAISSVNQSDEVLIPERSEAKFNHYGAQIGNLHVGNTAGTANSQIGSATDAVNLLNLYDGTGSLEFQARGNGQDIYFTESNGGEQLRLSNQTGMTVSSSETVKGTGGLGVKFGVIAGSVTASNLTSGQCVQANSNGTLTSSGGACGGGGGSSSLQVTSSGVQITSPTASMNFGTAFTLAAVGSTATVALNSSSVTLQGQNVINLASTLQAGATFFVSSGTVNGLLTVADSGTNAFPLTVFANRPSAGGETIFSTTTAISPELIVNDNNVASAAFRCDSTGCSMGGLTGGLPFTLKNQGTSTSITLNTDTSVTISSNTLVNGTLSQQGAPVILSTSTLQAGSTLFVSSGTINTLNTPTHNVTSNLNLVNTAGDNQATITDPGSTGQQQVQITAANGVGINHAPMPGQDLVVPNLTITGTCVGCTAGAFINNAATLQSGATFYVSSGTVDQALAIGGNGAAALRLTGNNWEYDTAAAPTVQPYLNLAATTVSLGGSPLGFLFENGSGVWGIALDPTSPGGSLRTREPISASSGVFVTGGILSDNITATSSATFNNSIAVASATTLSGNVIFSSTVVLGNGSGTNGQVETSGGPGTVPTWTTVGGGGASLSSTNTWTAQQTFNQSSIFVSSVTISTTVFASLVQVSSLPFVPSGFGGGQPGDIQMRANNGLTSRIYFYSGAGVAQGQINMTTGGSMNMSNENTTQTVNLISNFNTGVAVQSTGHTLLAHGIDVSGSSSTFTTPVIFKSSIAVVTPVANAYEATFSTTTPTSAAGNYQIAVTTSGVFSVGASSSPLLTSCGTTPAIVGTNAAFTITPGGSAAGCTVTFNPPLKNTPICVISPQTESIVNALSYTETNTAITFTQTSMTSKVDVHCYGNNE